MYACVVQVGRNIRRLRAAAGIRTQRELAERLGVPQPRVSDWENDRYTVLEMPTLLRIAKALRCSVDQLLAGVDPDYDRVREAVVGAAGAAPSTVDFLGDKAADLPVVAEGDAAPTPTNWRPSKKSAPPVILHRVPRPGDLHDPDAYGVEVRSDAMIPAHRPRMIAIVAPSHPLEDGDEVYAQLTSGECAIRLMHRMQGGYVLQSYNHGYATRIVRRKDVVGMHVIVYSRRLMV